MYLLIFCSFIFFNSWFIYNTESKLYFKQYKNYENDSNFLFKNSTQFKPSSENLDESNKTLYRNNSTSDITNLSFTNFNFVSVCRAAFIKPHNYVSIISIDNDYLDPRYVYIELGLAQWHDTVKTFTTSKAVIVIVKSSAELHNLLFYKQSSMWGQGSIFVIVVLECVEDVKLEMATLWQYYRIYKYVLICGGKNTLLYIYRPFVPTEGSRIMEVTNLSEIGDNILHGVNNLHGTEMRIVFFPRMPTAVAKRGKYIGGVDYNALLMLRDKMNFSPIIFRPSDGHTFAQAGKNISGSIRDIAIGNADIALNGHFLQDYKINEILLTQYMYMDKMCFIVAMPTFKSHYAVILHIFSPGVWGLIVVMYFTIVILYYGIQQITNKPCVGNYNIQELFFLLYGLIIFGASTIRSDIMSKKVLLGSVLITILILNNTFQGSLVTVLSRPIRNPFIDTLEQVIKSDLALQSQRAESLLSDPEIIQLLNVLRKRKLHTTNFIRLGRFPIMKLLSYRNYLNYKRNSTEHLHTVPECIMSNFLGYIVPKYSPFLERINYYLLKFQEVGLNTKWFGVEMDNLLRYTYWPLETEQLTQTQSKIFTMADVAFVFTLLLFGLTLSTTVFFIEKVIAIKKV